MTNPKFDIPEQSSRLDKIVFEAFDVALLVVAGFIAFVTVASA